MNQSGKRFLFDLPGCYRIRVQGQLSMSWSSRLGDMAITVRQPENQPPVTSLTGELRDQAALMAWFARPALMDAVFNTVILPCLGFLFLPFTTLMKGLGMSKDDLVRIDGELNGGKAAVCTLGRRR